MKNKYIQLLLEEIHKLESKVSNLKESQNVSFSFFKESFNQIQEINRLFHELEFVQIEDMKTQMEKLVQFLSESENSKSETPKQTKDDKNKFEMRDMDLQNESEEEKIIQKSDNKKKLSEKPIVSSSMETSQEENIKEFTQIEDVKKDKELDLSKTTLKSDEILHEKRFIKEDLPVNLATSSHNTTSKSLNDIQPTNHTILDTKKSISLNDRFLFQRELFDNDRQAMNIMLQKLQEFKLYKECEDYLSQNTDWNFKDKTVEKFLEMLKKNS